MNAKAKGSALAVTLTVGAMLIPSVAFAAAYPNPNVRPRAKWHRRQHRTAKARKIPTEGGTTTSVRNLGIPGGSTAACESPVLKDIKRQYKKAQAAGTTGGYSLDDVVSNITAQIAPACTNGFILNTTETATPASSSTSIPKLHSCSTKECGTSNLPPTYLVTWQGTSCDGESCYVGPGYPANSEWSETFKDQFLCDGIWASSAPPASLVGWNAALAPFWNVSQHWEYVWPYAGYGFNANYVLTRDYFDVKLGYGPVSHD